MAPKEDLTSVEIINPTSEDFTWNYNGEPYTVRAGEKTAFAKPVAYHLARHLSTKMIVDEVKGKMGKKQIENPRDPIHVKISQLSIYDTPERRIALYHILRDEEKVMQLLMRYPYKGTIGDLAEYQAFVDKEKAKQKEEIKA